MDVEKQPDSEYKSLYTVSRDTKIIGSIPFTEAYTINGDMAEERLSELLLVYSRKSIQIYRKQIPADELWEKYMKVKLMHETTIYGYILTIVSYKEPETNINCFTFLLEDGRLITCSYSVKLNCLEIVALHEVNTNTVLSLERKYIISPKSFVIKTDINGKGLCLMRSCSIFSFHLFGEYAKKFGIEGKVSTSGSIVLQKDFQQQRDLFTNSLHIDLRMLGVFDVVDFSFICHPTYITLYVIAGLPVYNDTEVIGFEHKLVEIRITPALMQKLRHINGNIEQGEQVTLKEHITTFPFLPKEMFKLFLLENYAIIVATSYGIIYINQTWNFIIAFEKEVAEKYAASLPNLQVQCCKIQLKNIDKELRSAKYSISGHTIAIELSEITVFLQLELSPYNHQKCTNVNVFWIRKKGLFDFHMISENISVVAVKETNYYRLIKTTPVISEEELRQLKVAQTNSMQRLLLLAAVEVVPTEMSTICSTFNFFCDLCTLRTSEYWDFAFINKQGGGYYIGIGQKELRAIKQKKLALESSSSKLINITNNLVLLQGENNSFYSITEGKVSKEEKDLNRLFPWIPEDKIDDPIITIDTKHEFKILVTVSYVYVFEAEESQYSLLSQYKLEHEIVEAQVIDKYIFLIDETKSLSILVIEDEMIEDKSISLLTDDETLSFILETLEGPFSAIDISHQSSSSFVILASSTGWLAIFRFDNELGFVPEFKTRADQGNYHLSNILYLGEEDTQKETMPNRSFTHPGWSLDGGKEFITSVYVIDAKLRVVGDTSILLLVLSSGDFIIYREVYWYDKESTKTYQNSFFTRESTEMTSKTMLDIGKKEKVENHLQDLKKNFGVNTVTCAENKGLIVSGRNIAPLLLCERNNRLFRHHLAASQETRIIFELNGNLVEISEGGAQVFEPHFPKFIKGVIPCNLYHLEGRPVRVLNISKDNVHCLLVWVVKERKNILELYRIEKGLKKVDYVEFDEEEVITGLQPTFVSFQGEYEESIAVMYITKQAGGFYSKWRLIRLKFDYQGTDSQIPSNVSMRIGEVNHDQEGNEMITCVFSVDGTLFVCIDNRILQMNMSSGKTMVRTYYPNMTYIVDAAVNNNLVALANIRGRVLFLVWIKEQNKLVEQACYNLGDAMLREISFFDNEQAKIIVSDENKVLYILSLFMENEGEEIALRVTNLFKIDSNTANIVNLRNWKGIEIMSLDGGRVRIASSKMKDSETAECIEKLHRLISSELPFFGGLQPLNYTKISTIENPYIEKLAKDHLLSFDALSAFFELSLPLQNHILQKMDIQRSALYRIVSEAANS